MKASKSTRRIVGPHEVLDSVENPGRSVALRLCASRQETRSQMANGSGGYLSKGRLYGEHMPARSEQIRIKLAAM